MPWTSADAQKHTKKASTAAQKKQWAKVANSALEQHGDEGKAIKAANAAVAKSQK
jgi:hypothetical protein